MTEPEFGYARPADGAYIAYAVMGEGPIDIAWSFDFLGNLDVVLEWPSIRQAFDALAGFSRVILHDRRGTGLSSRNVPVPNLETRAADLVAVLDAVGSERPVLGGEREGGAANVLLAAGDPGRVRSLIWYIPSPRSVWMPDYPWGITPEYLAKEQAALEVWGTRAYGEAFIEQEASVGHDIGQVDVALISKIARQWATPDVALELSRLWYETDIRPLLPTLRVPTLLLDYEQQREHLEYCRQLTPDARAVCLPGAERDDDPTALLAAIRDFLGVEAVAPSDTILTTVLFTDIVDSTALQARLGDRGWKELIEEHHRVVRGALERFNGLEQDTAGDGFFARFDGPARAIRCAQEITAAVRPLGIEIRAGLHTGECEIADRKCTGISVSTAARVMAKAGASEVFVSQTVKDLVAGSGLTFEDAGEHELKGVPDTWRLYRVVA